MRVCVPDRGPKKPVDEILPQLKTQTRRRLDSTVRAAPTTCPCTRRPRAVRVLPLARQGDSVVRPYPGTDTGAEPRRCAGLLAWQDAKKRQLQEHLEHLSAMTSSIADEVNVIQDSVQQKFRDMRRLLDEKEAKFKQDVAALASDVAASITEQEEQCQTVIGDLQHEADQLAHALEQETELGFVSGIANMPKHELEIDAALLKVPSVNFQARATLNSEPICQMIGELEFNVQQVRAPPVEYTPLSSSSSRPLARSPAMHVGALGGYSSTSVFASPQRTASSARDVPPSRELFVGGLPLHSSEDQVRQIFEGFGVIESLDMSNVA